MGGFEKAGSSLMKMKSMQLHVALIALTLVPAIMAGMNADSKKFLDENKGKEGVITLASGLQYKVLRKGSGIHHPTVSSPCECHYEGTLINGDKFDSSYDRGSPTTFAPNQVIKGWTEAMQLMVEGDKWEMYIPSELGYGDSGSPPKIQGGDVLVFQMEIIKIKGDKKPASKCDVKTMEGCKDKEKEYVEKMKGKGKEKVGSELKRLTKMRGEAMSEDKLGWLNQRVKLLEKMEKIKDEL